MNTVSPVVPGLEQYEIILGGKEAGQEQYIGIAALRSPEGVVVTRWQFTDEDRAAIAAGADLHLSVLTFNHPFQPVKLEIAPANDPNEARVIKKAMRLVDEFEMRTLLAEANKAAADLQARQLAILNGDAEVTNLAKAAQKARQTLERKKAEIFSDKPAGHGLEIVQ